MVYRGRIENGVVVLDDGCRLPEGTTVNVEPLPDVAPGDEDARRLADDLKNLAGTVRGLPPDFARNHDHYVHGRPKR